MATFVGYEVPGFAPYTPDFTALAATRVVAAVGDGAEGAPPWVRGAQAVAERVGAPPVVFPGDHGGFGGRTATAFAERLHETLDNSAIEGITSHVTRPRSVLLRLRRRLRHR